MNTIYPKTYVENLRYRTTLLEQANADEGVQGLLKDMCAKDRLFFFNVFMYTYDPRTTDKKLPFITYEFQDDVILWDVKMGVEQKDSLVEKSRDMGVTWMFIGNDLHDWLFKEERIEIRWGSRKEEYVDKRGDMDSIFEKFRYALKCMPGWMLPKGFNFNEHDNYMRLINPETQSVIVGESTNENFGRGGRKWRIRFDEFAFWDNTADNAYSGCADTTNARTVLSTPNGSSNRFAQLAQGNKEKIEKITIHWTLHPIKCKGTYYLDGSGTKIAVNTPEEAFGLWQRGVRVRSPWYDAECERRSESEVAQELDIDYLKSGSPFFDLQALSKQVEWEEYTREFSTDPIPYGRYVRAILIDRRGKVEVRDHPQGWLKIFEMPKYGWEYVVATDSSEGLAKGDETFCVVRDKITRNVVATMNGMYRPEEAAEYTFLIEKYYNDALNMPENNNHGYSLAMILDERGSNLYFTKRDEVKGYGIVQTPKRGWTTSPKTRPVILDELEEEIRKMSFELRDPELIQQFFTFVRAEKTGKPQADGDFLDDGVMATAICGRGITETPFKGNRELTITRNNALVHEFKRKTKNAGFKYGRKAKKEKVGI